MIKRQFIFLLFILLVLSLNCNAQSDTIQVDSVVVQNGDTLSSDTGKIRKRLFRPPSEWTRPEKAGVLALVIPGAGQIYNKKFWKLPLVYGIGGVFVSSVLYHHQEYKKVRDGLLYNTWTDTSFYYQDMRGELFLFQEPYVIGTRSQYSSARDHHRTTRDRAIVYTGVFYFVTIVDAIVDAHLKNFDLTDDLSMQINPSIYAVNNTFAPQVSLSFNFK